VVDLCWDQEQQAIQFIANDMDGGPGDSWVSVTPKDLDAIDPELFQRFVAAVNAGISYGLFRKCRGKVTKSGKLDAKQLGLFIESILASRSQIKRVMDESLHTRIQLAVEATKQL
jgi:hypothetical protein